MMVDVRFSPIFPRKLDPLHLFTIDVDHRERTRPSSKQMKLMIWNLRIPILFQHVLVTNKL